MDNPVYFTDPDGMSTKTYEGAAARELVSQMQANMERVQRQQYVFNTYGWPSGFDSFTGINNIGNGGVGIGQLLEFTEGIGESPVTKQKLFYQDIMKIYAKMTSGVEIIDGKPNPKYLSPNDLFRLIGGPILDEFNKNPDAFHNTCAVRLSYALNEAGYTIPKSAPGIYLADNGKYIITSAQKMYEYLKKTYEMAPNISENSNPKDPYAYKSSEVHNGIVVQSYDGNGIDHVDVILGTIPANRSYYSNITYIFKSDD